MTKKSQTLETSPFLQRHTVLIRIWHWLTFLTIASLMITVLLASTALKPRPNIKFVQERLEKKGITVTDEQAFSVAHGYDDKMWDVHKLIGYGLAFLLLSRGLIEVVQPNEDKIRTRIKAALKLTTTPTDNLKEIKHYLLVKRGYLVFYLLLLTIVFTGLGLAFEHDLAFFDQNHRLIKKVHEFCQYLMYGYVFIHLCGVIIADNRHAKGIVSGMINGNEEGK
ncbi:MAG: cytochrome b/b6 domain-containing protein [Bacteroidia bacterium]|nr:cytochrome b/b6 domain-containing protein [Bacteroidia bacterium]